MNNLGLSSGIRDLSLYPLGSQLTICVKSRTSLRIRTSCFLPTAKSANKPWSARCDQWALLTWVGRDLGVGVRGTWEHSSKMQGSTGAVPCTLEGGCWCFGPWVSWTLEGRGVGSTNMWYLCSWRGHLLSKLVLLYTGWLEKIVFREYPSSLLPLVEILVDYLTMGFVRWLLKDMKIQDTRVSFGNNSAL